MDIKVQSESISFKEFVEQHPSDVLLIPDSYGMDGGFLSQVIFQFALNLLKELIVYIAKKTIENRKEKKEKKKKEDIVFIFSDGHTLRVPVTDFDNVENVIEQVKNEYGKIKN